MGYFGWSEGMQLQVGIERLQLAEEAGIECQSKSRVVSALEEELVAAPAKGLFNFLFIGFDIGDISICVARDAIEIAEFAVGETNVGGIDVPVDLPGDLAMGDLHFPEFVGQVHEFGQGGVLKEEYAFVRVEK